MKNSKIVKAILFVSGLIAIGLAMAILIMPVGFYAAYGIEVAGDNSLLSEIKAPAIALLASGLLILSGAFVASLTFTATIVSAFLYLTFGLSRLLSMAVHGMPSDGLVQAAVLEIAIGSICLFALLKYRQTDPAQSARATPTAAGSEPCAPGGEMSAR
jgi:hypothetical protein